MGKNVRYYDRFQYYIEDIQCEYCLFYQKKSKYRRHGCNRDVCGFIAEWLDALANGRIKRKRGLKCQE